MRNKTTNEKTTTWVKWLLVPAIALFAATNLLAQTNTVTGVVTLIPFDTGSAENWTVGVGGTVAENETLGASTLGVELTVSRWVHLENFVPVEVGLRQAFFYVDPDWNWRTSLAGQVSVLSALNRVNVLVGPVASLVYGDDGDVVFEIGPEAELAVSLVGNVELFGRVGAPFDTDDGEFNLSTAVGLGLKF